MKMLMEELLEQNADPGDTHFEILNTERVKELEACIRCVKAVNKMIAAAPSSKEEIEFIIEVVSAANEAQGVKC